MKKHYVFCLIACHLFLCCGLRGQTSNGNRIGYLEAHPRQYFVKLCHGVSNQEVNELMAELNSVELWKNDRIGLRLWAVRNFPYSCSGGNVTDIEEQIVRSKKKTSVDDVMLDMVFQLEDTDFDERYIHFDNLNLRSEAGSTPIRIAILDSGISDEAFSTNGNYAGLRTYTGYDYVDNDPVPDDLHGHGTNIAGLIYNIISRSGPSPNIAFDVRKTHDENGLGSISNLISAVIDAVDAGAHIINMSFSYYEALDNEELNPLQLAIEYAEQKGVLVVASAGNQHRNNDQSEAVPVPASLPNENIIAVASNSPDEYLSSFSNYGANSVDVSILGENIPTIGLSGGREYVSGTSFSSAIVSALAAILGTRQNRFNGCEIKCMLINTSRKVSGLEGLIRSSGVIDFQNALRAPSNECRAACPDMTPAPEMDCGANCPPETDDMDLCVEAGVTVSDKLLVYDMEKDAVTYTGNATYGPFNGSVTILPDGTFTYTSFNGAADMFVYQVCNNKKEPCSDGCNQGVVYINTVRCSPPYEGEGDIPEIIVEDCVKATGDDPKLLTFRYTGQDCGASRYAQDPKKVTCSGNPRFAPLVYVTALGDKDRYYMVDQAVTLGQRFSIDAASVGEDKLKSTTTITIKDARGRLLQTISFETSGSQPLRVNDQFASLTLEGYLSKANVSCGNPDLENRNIYDCVKETKSNPRLLTFRYTGAACGASDHAQDPKKVSCSGDAGFAPAVYVTAVGDGKKYYLTGQEVALNGTFTIDAASVGENRLKATTTIYLTNKTGKTITQTITLHTSGSQPLGIKDRFGSLELTGYLAEKGGACGAPEVLILDNSNCCEKTGKSPRILTWQYTGSDCNATGPNQSPDIAQCSGDPDYAPFVYVTVESGDKKNKIFFRDLQVPLKGVFDIDAGSIGAKKFPTSVTIYLKDAGGSVLQTIDLLTNCSEPLGVGDRFGALRLVGYLAENDELCGSAPVSQVCTPTANCTATGRRSTIGLMYVGSTTATVDAYANTGGKDYIGSYTNVGPGDFIVFSSLYRNKVELSRFFLRWSGGREIEIPVETSTDILGNVYGDFKVVQQLDREGNDCRIPYSSCIEVNRHCSERDVLLRTEPGLSKPVTPDHSAGQLFTEKTVDMYPNPARNVLYLDLADYSGQAVDIGIYDSVSRLVKQVRNIPAPGAPLEMNLEALPNGVYHLVVRAAGEQTVTRKLVITRR